MSSKRNGGAPRSLDSDALNRLALHYVGRYATTQAKLATYLKRKLRERDWNDDIPPDVDAIVARCAALGYVDDRQFAENRSASLGRRGYGGRRIGMALQSAGIARDIVADVMPSDEEAVAAADAYARRKRIGQFGDHDPDPRVRNKQFAAMIRAGHSFELAKQFTNAVALSAQSEDV